MTDRLPDDLTIRSRPSYDHGELFRDGTPSGWTPRDDNEPRILNAKQYGATVTAHRALRTGVIAMAGTDGATSGEMDAVWRVVHALDRRIKAYQKLNNLPPAPVTP